MGTYFKRNAEPHLYFWRAAGDGHADGEHRMTEKVYVQERRYQRASPPSGMPVVWLGSDFAVFFSRVQTIGMGGLFIATPKPAPVGTKLRLTFQVPGGSVLPEAIVRNVAPGRGMGVEFTRMEPSERSLLENLMERLLR